MLRSLCIIFLLTSGLPVMAQSDTTSIATDRPTQTASAFTIAKGSIQIETGFAISTTKLGFFGVNEAKAEDIVFNSTQVRFGVTEKLELLFSQSLQKSRIIGTTPEINGDLELIPTALGARIRLRDMNNGGPQIALLTTVGGALLSGLELGTNIDARFNFQHNLKDGFSLGYNVGGIYRSFGESFSGIITTVVGYQASEKVGLFAEVYMIVPNLNRTLFQSDFGILYLVNPNVQIDVFGGFGISDLTPDSMFGAGLSVKIPKK